MDLNNIEHVPTRQSILSAICILATHQREAIVQTLLSHSLPYTEGISDCWKALAADTIQSTEVLDNLVESLKYITPYEERGPHASETIISGRLLSVIAAIRSMCLVHQLRSALLVNLFDYFYIGKSLIPFFKFLASLCRTFLFTSVSAGMLLRRITSHTFPYQKRRAEWIIFSSEPGSI